MRTQLILALCLAQLCQAQTVVSPPNYSITTPNNDFEFFVNGVSTGLPMTSGTDDSLNFSLNAGASYIFSVSTASIHPMDINTSPNNAVGSRYSGASAQDLSTGTVTLTIPATNYPATLYYICQIHSFYGTITVNPPQPPPSATILHTSVSTNIVLTFSGGTNTTSFGRLDAICGPDVFLRISQASN